MLYGAILWLFTIGLFFFIKISVLIFGDIGIQESESGYFELLSDVIFVYGICMIPIILGLAALLKLAERFIGSI